MLEYVLGEEQWKRVLNVYLKNHAYGNVETNDLQQSIKDVLGLNLDWFFDEWIYKGGEPHYSVHYEDLTYKNGSRGIEIAIEQIHKMDEVVHAFKMPIVIEVHFTDGSSRSVNEVIENEFEVVKLNDIGNKKIAFVLFDPNSMVLKQVSFKKSFEELEQQVELAPFMLDRYDALVAMRSVSIDQKREVLYEVLGREKHEGIINEVITQLSLDQTEKSQALLKDLTRFPKAAVRDNALKNISPNESNKSVFVLALNDSSYDVVKTALEKLCLAYPNEAETYLKATKDVHGMFHSVKMKWLELSILLSVDADKAKAELVEYGSAAYEFRTRGQAFMVLKSTSTFNDEVISNVFQAVLSPNGRLSGPAAELANHYGANVIFKEKMKKHFASSQFSEAEKEILIKSVFLLKN
jgi:aminopeptidase N